MAPTIKVEEKDEDEDSDVEPKKDFNLATFMKKETPPTSQRTLDPSPRRYLPTPSPAGQGGSGGHLPSPLGGFTSIPDLLQPIQSPSPPPLLHQGWKFMSSSHGQELGQQVSWLLIGCTRVNNQSEARTAN